MTETHFEQSLDKLDARKRLIRSTAAIIVAIAVVCCGTYLALPHLFASYYSWQAQRDFAKGDILAARTDNALAWAYEHRYDSRQLLDLMGLGISTLPLDKSYAAYPAGVTGAQCAHAVAEAMVALDWSPPRMIEGALHSTSAMCNDMLRRYDAAYSDYSAAIAAAPYDQRTRTMDMLFIAAVAQARGDRATASHLIADARAADPSVVAIAKRLAHDGKSHVFDGVQSEL